MKSKTKKKQSPPKFKVRPTLVAFLLDRSGSMSSCQHETITGFNGYLDGLKGDPNMRFTLTQFDSQGIDIIHDGVALKDVQKLTKETYVPRGNTPLYDAIGKTVRATESKAKDCNVLFVTLTDGEENSSSEWNENTVKSLIKEMEGKGWTFAHIGVGADGFAATSKYAAGTSSASNVMRSAVGDSAGRFKSMARATVAYCAFAGDAGPQGPAGPLENLWAKADAEES
jgi:uncharacterized protein YegL